MQEQRSACDSCRRRKVRCDSEQPCRKCVDSGVECTYGSSLRRASATSYVRTLEQQVTELQQQLQAAAPASSSLPLPFRQISQQQKQREEHIDLLVHPGDDLVIQQRAGARIYRFSAALNILRTIADMLDVGRTTAAPSTSPGLAIVEAIDPPLELPSSDPLDWLNVVLPPEPEMLRLISCALERALVCHQCIDQETFGVRVSELYDANKMHIVTRNKSFMSLIYATLALGERYSAEDEGGTKSQSDLRTSPPGFHYFRASRCLTHADLEPCDLDHVLARILQTRYLWSISHVSEAHSTLSKGISVATHMGLHFDDTALSTLYTSSELDERRRVFAVLYMMDVYVSFILGLPRSLSYAYPKQTLGLRSTDLHDEGQDLLSRNPTSPLAETVMAQKMFHIYAKILDHQSLSGSGGNAVEPESSWVASDWIASVQRDFHFWEAMLLDISSDVDDQLSSRELLGQMTLRLHYTGAQILLYAPYIHHLGRERSDANFNMDGFTYASDCVRAAAQTVLLVEILEAQGMLHAATWMNGFVLTLAASVLTYFVIYAKTRVTIEESKGAITKAGRMLESLGRSNAANKRVHESLSPYVDIVLMGHDT